MALILLAPGHPGKTSDPSCGSWQLRLPKFRSCLQLAGCLATREGLLLIAMFPVWTVEIIIASLLSVVVNIMLFNIGTSLEQP